MTQSIPRALAFHHQGGVMEQFRVAKKFGGPNGRVATVEDIVDARIATKDRWGFPWTGTFVTGSRVYSGTSKAGVPLLVFAHKKQPELDSYHELNRLDWENDDVGTIKDWAISQDKFEDLINGVYGDVHIVDLSTYKNNSVGNSASNRYKFAEAMENPIILGFLGSKAKEFLMTLHQMQQSWLSRQKQEVRDSTVIMCSRLYDFYMRHTNAGEKYFASSGYAKVRPLTFEDAVFYIPDNRHGERINRTTYGPDFGCATSSGIDDLIFSPYYVVGVKGSDPITSIERPFIQVVGNVKEQWEHFVEPVPEGIDIIDTYTGVQPDGSRDRPYYLPFRWGGGALASSRITENGAASNIPEFRLLKKERVKSKEVEYSCSSREYQYPYVDMWDACVKAMPEEANAMSFGGSRGGGSTHGVNATSTIFWNVEVEENPFKFLMKCGDRLFTQYSDEDKLTSQPCQLVEKSRVIKRRKRWEIPEEIYRLTDGCRDMWPVYAYLMDQSPKEANSVYIEDKSVGWVEKKSRNVMKVTVAYYYSIYGDVYFRPFSVIREDADWQLERRAQAGLLEAA